MLDPLFQKKEEKRSRAEVEKATPIDLRIFRITTLMTAQIRRLADACGVADSVKFTNAVVQHQLDMFTQRPGDVIDLATYYKTHQKFGTFAQMTEYGIKLKLKEVNAHRADNNILSDSDARAGAELLAAALTFGKSFTLRVPAHDPDPGLAPGAIDPDAILLDWSQAKRNALCRRAVFAPATYGRIRFHHRGTQEYLAAKWLDGLLHKNCPMTEIWNLLFVERYGVQTVSPSLHAVAAWLALWHSGIREEIIKREPLILMRGGDPASLPVTAKERLLENFSRKQAAGEISNTSLDRRDLWLFGDTKIGQSIRRAWDFNKRPEFRLDLLRLIREGRIHSCSDLALSVLRRASTDEYLQAVATEVLHSEAKPKHLKAMAKIFLQRAGTMNSRLAASYILALFPKSLSLKDLITAIAKVGLDRRNRAGGVGDRLPEIFELCPDDATKEAFLASIAKLCLSPPFLHSYHRISCKYIELAGSMHEVARHAIAHFRKATPGLIAVLLVVERSDRTYDLDDGPPMREVVRKLPDLNRALFWADVEDDAKIRGQAPSIRFWQLSSQGQLWGFDRNDLPWLKAELKVRKNVRERRIVLSAIAHFYASDLPAQEAELRALIDGANLLQEDLDAYLAPPAPTPAHARWKRRNDDIEKAQAKQREINKQSWRDFHAEIMTYSPELRDPEKLRHWLGGAARLHNLTRWIENRIDDSSPSAAREWRLLAEAFSLEVAEAYRDGMRVLWRITEPDRVEKKAGATISYKATSTLSVGGIGIEAAADPDWVDRLSDAEVERAFLHGVYDLFSYPGWLDELVDSRTDLLLTSVRQIFEAEWVSSADVGSTFLYHFASRRSLIPPALQDMLLAVISSPEPSTLRVLDYGLRILKKLDLDAARRQAWLEFARARLAACVGDERRNWAIRYLAMMMVIDINAAATEVCDWIVARDIEKPGYGEWAFGVLYERHDPIVSGVLDGATVTTLELFLDLAYRYVRLDQDLHHEGSFTPGPRDAAEEGRNTILSALLECTGPDAYLALMRLSRLPAIKLRRHRFLELAKGKAEKDSDFLAWSEAELLTFRDKYAAPVKTGHDLLEVTSSVMRDIQHGISRNDVSSAALLQKAETEEEVKNWLVEQMNFRANGRFVAAREPEIAFGDKPDVIVSSTSAAVTLAIEVKHGGKNWSVSDYELALTSQLARDYLKPSERRQGFLVISNHGSRTWRPTSGTTLSFSGLLSHLESIAAKIEANENGAIEVRVFGLDSVPEKPAKLHRLRAKTKRKAVSPAVRSTKEVVATTKPVTTKRKARA